MKKSYVVLSILLFIILLTILSATCFWIGVKVEQVSEKKINMDIVCNLRARPNFAVVFGNDTIPYTQGYYQGYSDAVNTTGLLKVIK